MGLGICVIFRVFRKFFLRVAIPWNENWLAQGPRYLSRDAAGGDNLLPSNGDEVVVGYNQRENIRQTL